MTVVLTARPARGNLNTPFGPRPKPTPSSPDTHYGEDYGWGLGYEIYAAADGVVVAYEQAGAYGKRLIIEHADGIRTWYCHTRDAVVEVGDIVQAGQLVAWMGNTGNTVGVHLHFELRIDGVAVNPAPYFNLTGVAGTSREDIDMATGDEILRVVNGYGLRTEQTEALVREIHAMVRGYGRRTEIIQEVLIPGTARRIEIVQEQLIPLLLEKDSELAERLQADTDELQATLNAALEQLGVGQADIDREVAEIRAEREVLAANAATL